MILRIKSKNPNLLSILNKNPNTDQGLYLKPCRNGHIIGNCVSENEYEILFHDTKYSFTRYEDNQIDFKSFCDPEVCLSILSELFLHLYKPKEELLETEIPWLSSTYRDIDNYGCEIKIDNFFIDSSWFRNEEFLLGRYIEGLSLKRNTDSNLFTLYLYKNTTIDVISNMALISFLTVISNKNDFYLQDSQLGKYVNVINNIENLPYFVYYLFIKRCCSISPIKFSKYIPLLESAYEKQSGKQCKFTINGTHKDRMIFVVDNSDLNKDILNFGCGEFSYEKFLKNKFKSHIYSYDREDYSSLYQKIKSRFSFDWTFLNELSSIPKYKKWGTIWISEVFEHNTLDEIEDICGFLKDLSFDKLIITMPNRNFNKYYNLGDQLRNSDHIFEPNEDEFKELMTNNFPKHKMEFKKVGDIVGNDFVTSGCIIT